MVSNKFAHRRKTRGTPTVCHVTKPPPPPPPPPPPTWPPSSFFMHCIVDFGSPEGPQHDDYIIQLDRVPDTWDWTGGTEMGPNYKLCTWKLYPETQQADISCSGYVNWYEFHMALERTPVTWGSEAHYHFTEWRGEGEQQSLKPQWVSPDDLVGSAEFDF